MINTDSPMMPIQTDELTSAKQDFNLDGPSLDDSNHCRWISTDNHHFDNNISDSRWAEYLLISQKKCVALMDLAARHLPAQFPQLIEVSLLWTDDQTVVGLNHRFRGKSEATNILSFPSGDQSGLAESRLFLGDLVLGYETIMSEAKAADIAEQDHIVHLILHGLPHLVGFDHIDDEKASEMEGLETHLLSEIGIEDPYNSAVYVSAEVRDTPS